MKFETLVEVLGSRDKVVNSIMSVYDAGDRTKMLTFAQDLADFELTNGYACGKAIGRWKGRFIGLAACFALYVGIDAYMAYKELKKEEKEEEK